ncbi:unnamed protein product, partial [Prorocentrum cordatum]
PFWLKCFSASTAAAPCPPPVPWGRPAKGRSALPSSSMARDRATRRAEAACRQSAPTSASRLAAARPDAKPEPPRPPLHKPSDVMWEVPPLYLPTVCFELHSPRRLASGGSSLCSTPGRTAGGDSAEGDFPRADGESEDHDEACIFSFEEDESKPTWSYSTGGPAQMHLVELEGDEAEDIGQRKHVDIWRQSRSSKQAFGTVGAEPDRLGASPVLLSALERVAAEAGSFDASDAAAAGWRQ